MRTTLLLFFGLTLSFFAVLYLELQGSSVAHSAPTASRLERIWQARLSSRSKRADKTAQPTKATTARTATKPNRRLFRRLLAASPITPVHAAPKLHPIFNQRDISQAHQRIANEAYNVIPARCQVIKNFYVREPSARNTKPPEHRGLAGKYTLILSGFVSDQEFRALFFHEVAHVISLNPSTKCLGGTPTSGKSEFRDGDDPVYKDSPMLDYYRISWLDSHRKKANIQSADFCSGYGGANQQFKGDVFEDFAECHALFILHNERFKELTATSTALAAKYRWFIKYLYPNGVQVSKSQHIFGQDRPWDVTKLPYEWQPRTRVAQSQ